MTRILADLPDDDIRWLDQLAERQGKSRASILREAVSAYRTERGDDALNEGFGLWARHCRSMGAVENQRQRRAEWTRAWDDDYTELRARSPELFDDHDDREHAHFRALQTRAIERHGPSSA